METKHTKGEWIIKPSASELYSDIQTQDGKRICECKSYGEGFNDATEDEREANAKLIAAAPELLKALIDCLYLIDQHDKTGVKAFEKAKLAIKKSTE